MLRMGWYSQGHKFGLIDGNRWEQPWAQSGLPAQHTALVFAFVFVFVFVFVFNYNCACNVGGSRVVVMMVARMLLPASIINTSVHPNIICKYTNQYTNIQTDIQIYKQ